MIYLDYNATAPIRPEVKQVIINALEEPLNPSSIHAKGRTARKLLEEARQSVLKSVNADQLIFCASGTEANNFALCQQSGKLILTSAIEHESVWKLKNASISVQQSGVIDLDNLEAQLATNKYSLVSVMLANNETGIIQPIKEVAKLAKKYGVLVHSDAVQAYGKIPISFKDTDIDFMTISCHKIGGPVGAAALIYKKDIELKPFLIGGGQEKNKRAGTENILAIIGLKKIADDINSNMQTSELQIYLEEEIAKVNPEAIIVGNKSSRIPNTSCIIHPKLEASTQLIALDMAGICVSSGSACSSGKVEVSRTLEAMGIKNAKNAIRISTGHATKRQDIENFISTWKKI